MPSRRPTPTILFTAIAATVVILPWAVTGMPGSHHKDGPGAADTLLNQQPLTGLGGGETVREISQSTPFSMVALTGSDLTGTTARVRAKRPDGSWGPWYDADAVESNADDSQHGGPRGTDPVFVGTTTTVQIVVTRPEGAPVTTAPPETGVDAGKELGYVPANVEQPFSQNISAVLITPPKAPVDSQWTPPTAALGPGQPPNIISRAQWGADDRMRCGGPLYGNGIRAAVVHHTAGSNDYAPEDSAAIVRSIYAYHTRTLGWCDIAYNALVDKYGQVFEGRAGGITKDVLGSHTGGFNRGVWGVSMIGDFETVPPTDIQIRTVGRLLGWRMGLDHVNPLGTVQLASAGGSYTVYPAGATPTLPEIFAHRDVGDTECPGNAGYAALPAIRDIAARFNRPPDIVDSLRGGAIFARWEALGGKDGSLGAPTTPEAAGEGDARYATFERGAVYWSPSTEAQPLTGAIYEAWASLGYERGALGLPTSGEIQEPEWIVQNFQHGTLNFDRQTRNVLRVVDGLTLVLPPPPADGPPVQLERFSRVENPVLEPAS
ncbi:N-acetylmuramoyl-L-alanine amidase [Candidatus Mycolicibacterium alkanivorans]|uniref:N-acetylmuramoyl-L-alanine amidase n=1 Tax=Candidatus Mycolicibacterium alkanivorans TaxID=2954114 RepID=A0ABS9YSR2_9MYCO|nr:N-acetylmuramoyl-L-alanine amidase [Candidatus Mycolicibacterium alkanivorans]MCI4674240.1 N-acetylmuramoyl-L-alanine amidase [Candidatus Mycolicibacterium alkanivorans]